MTENDCAALVEISQAELAQPKPKSGIPADVLLADSNSSEFEKRDPSLLTLTYEVAFDSLTFSTCYAILAAKI